MMFAAPRSLCLGMALFSCAGCAGGANPKTEAPPQGSGADGGAGEAGLGAMAPHETSPLDVVTGDTASAIHLDVAKLRASPLWKIVWPAVSSFPPAAKLIVMLGACKFTPIDSLNEVVLAAGKSDRFALRFDAEDADILACLGNLGPSPAQPLTLEGATGQRIGEKVALVRQHVVFVGDEGDAPAFLRGVRGPLASKLALSGDTMAIGEGEPDGSPIAHFTFTLADGADALAFDARFTLRSPELAAKAAEAKAMLSQELAHDPHAKEAKPFLDSLQITASGNDVKVHAGVVGGADAQATYLGAVGALATAAVGKYLHAAKSSEGRAVAGAIAHALAAHADEEGKDHGKFPPSAPSVPTTTPKGTAYQSSPKDWSHPSWQAIHFELREPQRFRYEFVTSADRKHVTVKAHGDLEGTGHEELFELPVDIGADGSARVGHFKDEEAAPAKPPR